MLKALFFALNVREKEKKQVLLLLGQGFFIGIFLTTFQITAETLFLNRLGHYLKEAILFSGFLGILSTILFSFFQKRISFQKLALANFIIIFLISLFTFLSFLFVDGSIHNYIIFFMFSISTPMLMVTLLSFWGIFGRLFDLRQSKRIIGGIDVGQILAAILTSFSIPLLQKVIINTQNYLILCCASILVAILFLSILMNNFELSDKKFETRQFQNDNIFKNNKTYVQLLFVFILISMLAFTFIQYSFQEVVKIQYPNETEIRNFLAVFKGGILILSLLLQTFVNEKIIGMYGIKVALMILPVILIVFTLLSIFTGHFYGYESNTSTMFIWFFLFVTLSRLFNYSIRDSLENPTFKLFFMPLDAKIRFNIQTDVEGIGGEFSRFIAGCLILLLSYFSFIELIHYSYAALIIIILYFFIINKLYAEYKNSVVAKLERTQERYLDYSFSPIQKLLKKLSNYLTKTNIEKVLFSYKLIEKVDPKIIPESINLLMTHQVNEIRHFGQLKLNDFKGTSVSERYVVTTNESDTKNKDIISKNDLFSLFENGGISRTRIIDLSKSNLPNDRQYAAELLLNTTDEDSIWILIELLNDTNDVVRITAIRVAQKRYNNDILIALINNLKNPKFSVLAANSLLTIGVKALDSLNVCFDKMGQTRQVKLKIIQTIGKIGSKKAQKILWSKIHYPDKVVVYHILSALCWTGFRANMSQVAILKYAIENTLQDIAWNISAFCEISQGQIDELILNALKEDINYDIDYIYMVLSMLYDTQTVRLIKESVQSQTSEGLIYGIELIDVLLSEDLKQKIILLLDDLSFEEKSKRFEQIYPRSNFDSNTSLKFLLNRDFSQTNRWTKATILHYIGRMKLKGFDFEIIANLFHPDKLLMETAAKALYNINPNAFEENVRRIEHKMAVFLSKLILTNDTIKFLFEKVKFLKSLKIFDDIYAITLANFVDISEEITIGRGTVLNINQEFDKYFYIVYKGSIVVEEKREITNINVGDFIGEIRRTSNQEKNRTIFASEDTVLLKIYKDGFYDLLSENPNVANKIIENV